MNVDIKVTVWLAVITSLIIIVSGCIVLARILKGSRSQFALKLTVLSIAQGIFSMRILVIYYFYLTKDMSYHEFYNYATWSDLVYYLLKLQFWVLGMRYLHTAIQLSPNPIISLQKQKFLKYSVVFVYCGWYFTSFVFQYIKVKNYDFGTGERWILYFFQLWWTLYEANLVFYACFFMVATIITVYSIYKQFQFIANLKKEFAFDINKAAFAIHAVLMLMQVGTSILRVV